MIYLPIVQHVRQTCAIKFVSVSVPKIIGYSVGGDDVFLLRPRGSTDDNTFVPKTHSYRDNLQGFDDISNLELCVAFYDHSTGSVCLVIGCVPTHITFVRLFRNTKFLLERLEVSDKRKITILEPRRLIKR